jgi:hypothetical protein
MKTGDCSRFTFGISCDQRNLPMPLEPAISRIQSQAELSLSLVN